MTVASTSRLRARHPDAVSAADMSAATWQDTIDVDLTAVFLLNGAALRPMLD